MEQTEQYTRSRRKRHHSNGEGSIRHRLNDGLWEARITVEGKRRSHYAHTRTEASRWLAEQRRNRDHGLPIVLNERTTLVTFLDDWLVRVEPRLRPSTHRHYQELAGHLTRHLGTVPLAKLSPTQIGRCYAALQRPAHTPDRQQPAGTGVGRAAAALSPTTVHHCHAVLRKALGDAVREGVIARNVATLIAGVPTIAHFEPTIWTVEQTRAFLKEVRADRLGALYLLAALTGLRNGELCALRWTDVDLDARTLQVRQAFQRGKRHQSQIVGAPKTKSSRRRVELPLLAVNALRSHRARQAEERLALGEAWQDTTGLIFTSTVGSPLDGENLLQAFHALLDCLGLPRVRLHDLRHLQASLLLAAGVHAKVVAERLGHSRVQVTLDTYSHVASGLQREAADVLDRLLGSTDDTEATGERGQGAGAAEG